MNYHQIKFAVLILEKFYNHYLLTEERHGQPPAPEFYINVSLLELRKWSRSVAGATTGTKEFYDRVFTLNVVYKLGIPVPS